MTNHDPSTPHGNSRPSYAPSDADAYRLQTLLLAGVASATLMAGNGVAHAEPLIWNISGGERGASDDLENTQPFTNDTIYTGNVRSNTDSIDNNPDGRWIGDILGNDGRISNNAGAEWAGAVEANLGDIYNYGGWDGDVEANGGQINNYGGFWTGDILSNDSQIANDLNGIWNGDILGNSNTVFNMTGSTWTGDVIANGSTDTFALIINRGRWVGGVKGNSGGVFNDHGFWDGDVEGNSGAVINLAGTWTGDVAANAGSVSNTESAMWKGDVLSNANSINNDAGSTWNGDVVGNGSSGTYAQLVNYGQWIGDVRGNAGFLINEGGSWDGDVTSNDGLVGNLGGRWNGDIRGNNNAISNQVGGIWTGDVIANGGGSNGQTQIMNGAAWTGDIQSNAGTIYNEQAGIWTGDVLANAGRIVTSTVWNGDFSSAGRVYAEGAINGAFTNSGELRVTGALTGITTLRNTGRVNMTGGGAAQTLTVTDAEFSDSSFLDIDVDAAGGADKLIADTAALNGTVRVAVNTTGGAYKADTVYEIVSANSITGTFDTVMTDLAFLAAGLSYDDTAVQLTLRRNDIGFAEMGSTDNQQSAAAAAESLGAGNEIYDAILWLGQDEAGEAFDDLSGEGYASFETVSIQSAAVIADLITARLDSAASERGTPPERSAGAAADFALPQGTGVWTALYGASSNLSGDGNTVDVTSTMGGVAVGIDGLVGDWRLGAMMHAGRTRADVDERATSGKSTDYGVGVYGGREWGPTRLALGATYTRHDWDVSREVDIAGFADSLTADYTSGTTQAFGKVSHAFDLGHMSLIPYASLAYVYQSADGFGETGGAAALEGGSQTVNATFATLGLGGEREIVLSGMVLRARAALGWRHGHSDATGATRSIVGGDEFYVVGASVPADMAILNAGINLDIDADNTLGFVYDGQIGKNGAGNHVLKISWNMRF